MGPARGLIDNTGFPDRISTRRRGSWFESLNPAGETVVLRKLRRSRRSLPSDDSSFVNGVELSVDGVHLGPSEIGWSVQAALSASRTRRKFRSGPKGCAGRKQMKVLYRCNRAR